MVPVDRVAYQQDRLAPEPLKVVDPPILGVRSAAGGLCLGEGGGEGWLGGA